MALHFSSLTTIQKGALSLVIGILILLYAFNIMQKFLTTIVILVGIGLVWYGLTELGIIDLIKIKFFKSK